ncbi:ATP-binding cassette domain-containing protein [Candidatus Enterococcus ikei]|uniref:ABC transporter ATP-binding protein n=1 Tax=Candidatus Enterococcus ikei TaxID=2815326 RepID=A0ABS3H1N6_9ENTE|nr:ABC transporter ATP-binding protein [Enterococcus sp. DIV0869a]MBO0441435.1 ABC transporter ATP-binding protein [Enterococcus sp. DIV0869a]
MDVIKFIKNFKKGNSIKLLIFIVINVFLALLTNIIPLISGNFIDSLLKIGTMTIIYDFVKILTIVITIQLLLSFYLQIIESKISTNIAYNIVVALELHLNKVDFLTIDNLDTKDASQRIYTDSQNVSAFILETYGMIIMKSLSFLSALFLLFTFDKNLALMLTLLIIVYIVYINLLKKSLYIKQMNTKNASSKYFSVVQNNLNIIKYSNLYRLIGRIKRSTYDGYKNLQHSLINFKIFSFTFIIGDNLLFLLAQIGIFIVGGNAVIKGTLSIGDFSIMISYFNILLESVKYFSKFISTYTEAKVSVSRLNNFFELPTSSNGGATPNKISILELENIFFTYPTNFLPVISNFSQTFKKGEIYCLIGPNGCGKSSILNIVAALYTNLNGEYKINQMDFQDLDKEYFYENILSYTMQKNIFISDEYLSDIITDETSMFFTDKFDLAMKMNIPLSQLSEGELKKVNLIQSFSKNNEILILDEPTNHLDSRSKQIIIDYLLNSKKDKIIIIATHDEDLINIADVLIKL